MKKCMITITEVLDNKPCQTMVLDITDDTISVNCPENSETNRAWQNVMRL
ncbi:MAG: hypothetical protein P8X67_15505 [Syntrophobacterales bacterium]